MFDRGCLTVIYTRIYTGYHCLAFTEAESLEAQREDSKDASSSSALPVSVRDFQAFRFAYAMRTRTTKKSGAEDLRGRARAFGMKRAACGTTEDGTQLTPLFNHGYPAGQTLSASCRLPCYKIVLALSQLL